MLQCNKFPPGLIVQGVRSFGWVVDDLGTTKVISSGIVYSHQSVICDQVSEDIFVALSYWPDGRFEKKKIISNFQANSTH